MNLKCDETCKGGDNCTNSRIYISGLPKGCTADDITDMFGGLGTIARERPQGRGVFPDMMPYRVKFYGNDDCLLHYEDPHAAHAAPSFFDGQELKVEAPRRDGREEAEPGAYLQGIYLRRPRASPTALAVRGAAAAAPRQLRPAGGNYGGGGGYGGPRRDDRRGDDYGRRDDRRDYDRRDRRHDYGRDRSRRSRSRDRDRDRRGYGGDRGRDRRSRSRSRRPAPRRPPLLLLACAQRPPEVRIAPAI